MGLNEQQKQFLRQQKYRERKRMRTEFYFDHVFGCRLISTKQGDIRVRNPKNYLSRYEKYQLSGFPRYEVGGYQLKPQRLPDVMI